MRRVIGVSSVLVMALSGSAAQAALQLVTDQTSYTVTAQQPAVVHVYLRETNNEITSHGGLNAAAAELVPQTPVPGQPLTLSAITPDAAFNLNQVNLGKGLMSVGLNDLNGGVAVTQSMVELGVFKISLGTGGQSTSYQITPAVGNWTYMADETQPGDSTILPSAVFTVAVPEPASLGLLGLGGMLALRRARRASAI